MMQGLLLLLLAMSISGLDVKRYSQRPVQYHIQTDDGDRRYFRYQTYNGQWRKERRLKDGGVVGADGGTDNQGMLRLYDYMADNQGYRIVRERNIQLNATTQPDATKFLPPPPRKDLGSQHLGLNEVGGGNYKSWKHNNRAMKKQRDQLNKSNRKRKYYKKARMLQKGRKKISEDQKENKMIFKDQKEDKIMFKNESEDRKGEETRRINSIISFPGKSIVNMDVGNDIHSDGRVLPSSRSLKMNTVGNHFRSRSKATFGKTQRYSVNKGKKISNNNVLRSEFNEKQASSDNNLKRINGQRYLTKPSNPADEGKPEEIPDKTLEKRKSRIPMSRKLRARYHSKL